jgi:hypothetical protein
MKTLNNHLSNTHTQNGEDGIITYILSKIPDLNNICVEFGAWDGKHLSNTFRLIDEHSYTAYLIEGDKEKYEDLLKTALEYPKIVPILSYVNWEGVDSLDNLLKSNGLTTVDFDLLSIDIDGLDYKVWKHFVEYKPKVIIFEINSSINPAILFSEEELSEAMLMQRGVNFNTAVTLAKEKGYVLLIHTGNCIFIREDYVQYIPEAKEFYSNEDSGTLAKQLELFKTSWLS